MLYLYLYLYLYPYPYPYPYLNTNTNTNTNTNLNLALDIVGIRTKPAPHKIYGQTKQPFKPSVEVYLAHTRRITRFAASQSAPERV